MLRSDWKFQYLAADLAVAARTKRDHHASRLSWWEGQQQAVIAEVREKGLEVSESIAMQYGSTKAILGGSRNAGAQISTLIPNFQCACSVQACSTSQHPS